MITGHKDKRAEADISFEINAEMPDITDTDGNPCGLCIATIHSHRRDIAEACAASISEVTGLRTWLVLLDTIRTEL